jgi:hypothetical protein
VVRLEGVVISHLRQQADPTAGLKGHQLLAGADAFCIEGAPKRIINADGDKIRNSSRILGGKWLQKKSSPCR